MTCNGAATGTGNVTNIGGGSGSELYWWNNGTTTFTTNNVTMLSAGIWSVIVTDSLTGCTLTDLFFVSQPPPMSLNLATSSPTICAGRTFSAT